MRRLFLMMTVLVGACGVEDYGKELPVTQVPVDPPPPPPTPGALSLVVEGSRIQSVVGKPAIVKVHVPDRDKLASVLTVTLETPPPGFSMPPTNLAVGKDAAELSLFASIVTPSAPTVITLALTSVRGEEARVSVPVEVSGRPGSVDTSFQSVAQALKLGATTMIPTIVVEANGRTLVSGAEASTIVGTTPRAGVGRLLSTGGLDYTFTNEVGSLGIVHFTPNPPLQGETVYGLSVDDKGRVVGAISSTSSYLQRLLPNGQIDPTFGDVKVGDGRVRFPDFSAVLGLVGDRDGVVACGQERLNNRQVPFLRRFDANGQRDGSFATEWLPLDTRISFIQNLVRSPAGRFAFSSSSSIAGGYLVFLTEVDGVPLSTFGDRGTVLFPSSDWVQITGLALSNDALFVYGTKRTKEGVQRARVVKLRLDGVRDPSFGVNGELIAQSTSSFARLIVDGRGQLVSVGLAPSPSTSAVLERWTTTGQADTGFGVGGRVQFASVQDGALSVAVRPNGRILTVHRVGSTTVGTLQVTQFWD